MEERKNEKRLAFLHAVLSVICLDKGTKSRTTRFENRKKKEQNKMKKRRERSNGNCCSIFYFSKKKENKSLPPTSVL